MLHTAGTKTEAAGGMKAGAGAQGEIALLFFYGLIIALEDIPLDLLLPLCSDRGSRRDEGRRSR